MRQALARKMAAGRSTPKDKARLGFRLCLSRQPSKAELASLMELYEKTLPRFQMEPDKAREAASKPIGDASEKLDTAELAAWTVVGSVLLNLDEMLMKR